MLAALRILGHVLGYRLQRLEMANLAAAAALVVALRLPPAEAALRFVYALLLNLFSYLNNDYYDVERDLEGGRDVEKTRYLREHLGAALAAQIALALALVALALGYDPELLVAGGLGAGVCWAYSARLKRVPYADVAAMTLWGAAMPLAAVPLDNELGWALVGQLALFSTCFELIQVLRDREEDAVARLETTAVRLGARRTLLLARLAMLATAVYAALILQRWLGLALLVAPLLPAPNASDGSAEAIARYWNRVRLVFGLVWLATLAWVYTTGQSAGWLVRAPGALAT
jgi:4-hydroxybenzoate polyprenyltransferase